MPRTYTPLSKETKEKIRKAHLGKRLSKEHRAKVVKTLVNGERAKGENNPAWKGGRCRTKEGYVLLRMPEHPNARSNGYFPEHRYVMEQHLNRTLNREEVVHHINHVKNDNRIENLSLTTHKEHGEEHWRDPKMRKWQSERVKKLRKERFWSSSPKARN